MSKKELLVYLQLFIRPTIVALLVAIVWYFIFRRFGFSIPEADESAFTDAGIPVIAMFHAIVAGGVLVKVWEEHKAVLRCIKKEDRNAFLDCVQSRIPMVIHLLLGSMSIIIIFLTMMIHFEGALGGIAMNSSVAFVLALYWEVATNLDDPVKGVWYVGKIPKDWL